jgi:2,3-bisphosphoglycerate-dependent phosphoglycerate mutase
MIHLPGQASPALHLVRHGQSTWNDEGRLQGQVDLPELTERGRAQAAFAATSLADSTVERLLTSDLTRAVQTAEIIGWTIGLVPIPTTLLRELHYGTLQGMKTEQAAEEWTRLAQSAVDEYGDPLAVSERRIAGGESVLDVRARVDALLATPWITEAAGDVVLVTHGDTIRVMLGSLLGDDPDEPIWRSVGNGEVLSVYRDAEGEIRHVRTKESERVGPIPQP